MEGSHGVSAPRRAPFTDIQNTHVSAQTNAAKPSEKAPLSNKLRAIQIGQRTLAAFKERKAEAKARRTAAKAAAPDPVHPQWPSQGSAIWTGPPASAAAPNACSDAAPHTSARVMLQRHAQTPSKIPSASHAPRRSGASLSAPTPTKIPSAPKVEGLGASAPSAASVLQSQSVPVSPTQKAVTGARPYSGLPTPSISPQAACIEGGLTGAQRNPLFDDAAPRTASPAAGLAAATSVPYPPARQDQGVRTHSCAGAHAEGQQPAAHEAACPGSVSDSSCSSTVLAGPRPLSIEVDYIGGSGPQSAHSMASGLSRSGSFAPSTLSVLYENQAMKVEREELKFELKLISARLAVLEARSKGWGRIGQAPKGRSQSAPRGVPRTRIAAARRPASITEQHAVPARAGRAQHRAGRPETLIVPRDSDPNAVKVARQTASRPSSARPGRAASFGGSRASSPAQQRRAIVFGSRAPSPTRGHSQSTRNATSQKPASSRAGSPVPRGAARRQNEQRNALGSGQSAAPMQPSSTTDEAPARQMPYRSVFMGGHMTGTCRALPTAVPSAQSAPTVPMAEAGKPDLASAGPPAPPAGTPSIACPSSVERWAGPGGRLGRTKLMRQTPRKGSRQNTCEDKENTATDLVEPKEQVSKLALTAAKLGLQHAFRPRLV